jgi:hypothetical protein
MTDTTETDTTDHDDIEDVEQPFGRTIEERFERRLRMNVPDRRNDRLRAFIERVNADDDLYALWLAANA